MAARLALRLVISDFSIVDTSDLEPQGKRLKTLRFD